MNPSKNKVDSETEPKSNSFVTTLTELRHGDTVAELSEKLVELIGKVRETGTGGKLTLKLVVTPAAKGNVQRIDVEDEITLKLPKTVSESTIFFATDDNLLKRVRSCLWRFDSATASRTVCSPSFVSLSGRTRSSRAPSAR